jgi:pimeloyl-ACP methyl ester carboxylesterase
VNPTTQPFRQLRFDDLPDEPRRPHPFFATTAREVLVDSAAFGRVRIHVREHGQGPPLLLVHGLMTSSYSWRYVVEPLGRRFRCLVPDLPGCGRSDKPDVRYDAPALARFVGELAGALDVRGCDVIGNSLGGYLCMRLALDDPGAIGRLVAVHCPGVPLARLAALRVALSLPGSRRLLDWMVARDPERWAHRNVHYWDESLKSREEAREYGAPLATPEGRRAFTRYLADTLRPADMRRFVAELRARESFPVPLLLVFARRDPMVPPVVGERLGALVPDARLVWLDDASHFAHVDAPERLLEVVLPFLNGEPPA